MYYKVTHFFDIPYNITMYFVLYFRIWIEMSLYIICHQWSLWLPSIKAAC